MPQPKKIPGVETVTRKRRGGSTYFEYRVRWVDPLTGKRLGEYFATPGEALDFKAKLRIAKRRGGVEDLDRGRTLLAHFAETWLMEWAASNLTNRTLRSYAGTYNKHLLPRVGHLQLRQITPRVVQQLRQDLEADDVGPSVVRKALAILQAMLRQAVVWGELTANPVQAVEKPEARRATAVIPWSVAQVEALLDELDDRAGPIARMLAELVAYSGARPQDALALRWRHVGQTAIVYAEKNVEGKLLAGAKTGATKVRSVSMLRHLRSDLMAYRLAHGAPGPDELVIARPDGSAWLDHDYRNWRRRVFAPCAEKVGLPAATPYHLRHTYASMRLAEQRLSLQEIAVEMGHSLEVLARTYSHVIAEYAGQGPVDPDALIAAARGGTKEATA